ncbi:MAG: toll/interleukin-1 receptor domain-containing protein [Peptococcaceae bacterium]|jgi:hypothetical protein|nr:toll/interleukin-1 receptor domain-containing protein [Peptococcaceae bacterium]
MAPFKVFLSHDHRDEQLALYVHNILDKVGMSPYTYEVNRQYRQSLPESIREVIKSSSACLALLTLNGVRSSWVHQEIGLAFGHNKIIIAALEQGVDFSDKGFVQPIPHIVYAPYNIDGFCYEMVYALRNEVFGHNERDGLRLICPNGHESRQYRLPATEIVNTFVEAQHFIPFRCTTCNTEILVSPWTFEEKPSNG